MSSMPIALMASVRASESTVAGRVQRESEALEVCLQPGHHVVRGAWRGRAPDAWEEAFADGVVFPFADLDGERAMVLAGPVEHVKVEEQVAGLKGSQLGATLQHTVARTVARALHCCT